MKKLFVSMPMYGRSLTDATFSLKKMHCLAELMFGEKLELIDTCLVNELRRDGIAELARHIQGLKEADYYIGVEDVACEGVWTNCCIENQIAKAYGIPHTLVDGYTAMPDLKDVRRRLLDKIMENYRF